MTNIKGTKGDRALQPPECNDGSFSCPNIKSQEGWDGEWWRCDVCGESFYLDYEEMK